MPGKDAEDEQWQTVTRSDKKRIMRKGRVSRKTTPQTVATATKVTARAATLTGNNEMIQFTDRVEDADTLVQLILECQSLLVTTDMWNHFHQVIEKKTESMHVNVNDIQQLICYGIGNFSQTSTHHYSASLWQLAFALCLREDPMFHVMSRIYYHDPCTTEVERNVLHTLHVEWIPENERGQRCVHSVPTLFFLPHCPRTLYENVMKTNWEHVTQCSSHIYMIGNSIRDMCELMRQPSEQQPPPFSAYPCLRFLLPYTHEYALTTSKRDKKESPGNIVGAFNDTFLIEWNAIPANEETWSLPYESVSQVNELSQDPELL
jgi:hypothetical protein